MITGICYPCATILYAAVKAKEVQTDTNTVKVGKESGVWYCVVVF